MSDTSWMDAAWTVYLDRALMVVMVVLALYALVGLAGALAAPGILRGRLYRNWAGPSAQTPRVLVPELVMLLAYAVTMTSQLWPVRPPGMALVTLLALVGLLLTTWRRRSRERRQAG